MKSNLDYFLLNKRIINFESNLQKSSAVNKKKVYVQQVKRYLWHLFNVLKHIKSCSWITHRTKSVYLAVLYGKDIKVIFTQWNNTINKLINQQDTYSVIRHYYDSNRIILYANANACVGFFLSSISDVNCFLHHIVLFQLHIAPVK